MVDASIGGKTALNVNDIRNLIGSFQTPKEVVLYFDFLQTLNQKEMCNGYAEIIKYSLILDYKLFELLESYFINKVKEISTDKIRKDKKGKQI